jgi:hypothetical protein
VTLYSTPRGLPEYQVADLKLWVFIKPYDRHVRALAGHGSSLTVACTLRTLWEPVDSHPPPLHASIKGHRSRRDSLEKVHSPPHRQVTRCIAVAASIGRLLNRGSCDIRAVHLTMRPVVCRTKAPTTWSRNAIKGVVNRQGWYGGSERNPPPARLRLNCREAEKQMAGGCSPAKPSLLLSCSYHHRHVQHRCVSQPRV